MASTIEVPDKQNAVTVTCPIPVSTKVNGEKKEATFEAELPKTLGSAVALYGEDEVFKKFINSLVISLQGEQRNKLQAEGGGKEPRAKAKYLDALGI